MLLVGLKRLVGHITVRVLTYRRLQQEGETGIKCRHIILARQYCANGNLKERGTDVTWR